MSDRVHEVHRFSLPYWLSDRLSYRNLRPSAKLFKRAHRYRRISSEFRPYWRPKTEHKAIMDAVLARNSSKAAKLIERHIRETTRNLLEHASHLFEPGDWIDKNASAAPGSKPSK
jgi:DNA-binding GntR family transcriptional regulator